MAWIVEYDPRAQKDLEGPDRNWRYRVRDYRIICEVQQSRQQLAGWQASRVAVLGCGPPGRGCQNIVLTVNPAACFCLTKRPPSRSLISSPPTFATETRGWLTTRRPAGFGVLRGQGLRDLAQVKPMHVAADVEALLADLSKPTVKQQLAALRMLFEG